VAYLFFVPSIVKIVLNIKESAGNQKVVFSSFSHCACGAPSGHDFFRFFPRWTCVARPTANKTREKTRQLGFYSCQAHKVGLAIVWVFFCLAKKKTKHSHTARRFYIFCRLKPTEKKSIRKNRRLKQ
jgi:hypothetical protein